MRFVLASWNWQKTASPSTDQTDFRARRHDGLDPRRYGAKKKQRRVATMQDYWWPFAVRCHHLVTRLTPQGCCERLQPQVRPMPFLPVSLPPHHIYGEVTSTGFTIRKAVVHSRQMQTVAAGRFAPNSRGTEIDVKLSADTFSTVFLAVWLGGVFLFLLSGVASWFGSQPGHRPSLAFIIIPTWMLLGGYGVGVLFRWLAIGEEDRLVHFLKKTLQADEVVR
jgi:hypothetical protein